MSNLHTKPTLSSTIIAILNHWRSAQPLPHFAHDNPAHQQALIGWYPLLLGHLSTHWTRAQERHYQSIQSKQSPRRWTIQVIRQLLNISWDMWTHRNGFKHGPTRPDATSLHERITHDIENEYSLGTSTLLPRNHHWLSKPIHITKRLNIATQQQWLQSITIARE